MFNLALKLLFSRKKWLLIMVSSLAIMVAAVISIFTTSEAIKEGLKEKSYELYGEHSGILTNIDESKKSLQNKGIAVGEYQLTGTMVFDKDKVATIGWMDKDGLKLSHLKLLEGEFPAKENEVAIESTYLQLIDDSWKVGQIRKLLIYNKDVEVRLVGIVRNYSAQWSLPIHLEKGINDLPNIFISNQHINTTNKPKNYLIKLDDNKKTAEKKMRQLLDEYNQNGVINDRLFYKGLKDYDSVSFLSLTFQFLILFLSLFCIVSLFTYFNNEQSQKIAVLKAIGANKQNLYKLYFYQCLMIFLLSITASIPLQLLFYSLIIENSFKQGLFNPTNMYFLIIIIWLLLIFLITLFTFILSVKKSSNFSVNELLSKNIEQSRLYVRITRGIHSFSCKQLARQLFIIPKQVFLTVLILCFSILLMTFSVFIQFESAGIWDTKQAYYLTSQETYGFDTINNLNVLKNQGLTFSVKDVQELERTQGILYIEKNPFMIDVHPIINPDLVTPSIRMWIEKYSSDSNLYKGKEIIPNVRYYIVDSKEFRRIFPSKRFADFAGKIMLFIPSQSKGSEEEKLIGEKLHFAKRFNGASGLDTIERDFKIFDVSNKPFVMEITNSQKIEYDEITVVFDLQTAIESGLFHGYNELGIYIQSNLSYKEYQRIDNKVHRLIATIPGSLFQNIPEFQKEDSKIYSLVGSLGILSFIVATILAVISIVIIVFGKYRLQKRNWGIYLSLGMNKNQVMRFLTVEMLSYLVMATFISMVICIIALNTINHVYPFTVYLKYYCMAILTLLLLILIGSKILEKVIKKQSISSILRRIE